MTRRRRLAWGLGLLLSAGVLAGCVGLLLGPCGLGAYDHRGAVAVADVSQPADLVLAVAVRPGCPPCDPSWLHVRITGELAGEAEVWVDGRDPVRLSGRVDWRQGGDWFEPTAVLYYRPLGPVSGHLTVHYEFG